jgi:hypothetical protein
LFRIETAVPETPGQLSAKRLLPHVQKGRRMLFCASFSRARCFSRDERRLNMRKIFIAGGQMFKRSLGLDLAVFEGRFTDPEKTRAIRTNESARKPALSNERQTKENHAHTQNARP